MLSTLLFSCCDLLYHTVPLLLLAFDLLCFFLPYYLDPLSMHIRDVGACRFYFHMCRSLSALAGPMSL